MQIKISRSIRKRFIILIRESGTMAQRLAVCNLIFANKQFLFQVILFSSYQYFAHTSHPCRWRCHAAP